jgi:Tol biopolymer transport system component
VPRLKLQLWELVWVDREGTEEPLPTPAAAYTYPRLSPDGRQVAVSLSRESGRDLWTYDVETGAGLRLTRDDEVNQVPIWTRDGRILYSSTRDAPRPPGFAASWWGNAYSVAADGSSAPVRISETDESQGLTGISPDGRMMVYSRVMQAQWEIIGRPLDGSAEPTVFVSGPFRQGTGSVSPDGRWLAYRSDETGRFEVYVQPYPGPGAKVPVSIGGGTQPVWSADGTEIFYRTLEGDTMMSARISGEGTPEVTERTSLFSTAPYRSGGNNYRHYHVAPDGRFLMMRRTGEGSDEDPQLGRINVVLDWFAELRERVPSN